MASLASCQRLGETVLESAAELLRRGLITEGCAYAGAENKQVAVFCGIPLPSPVAARQV